MTKLVQKFASENKSNSEHRSTQQRLFHKKDTNRHNILVEGQISFSGSRSLDILGRHSKIIYAKEGMHFVAAGGQLEKAVEGGTRDRTCACAKAQSRNNLHTFTAALPRRRLAHSPSGNALVPRVGKSNAAGLEGGAEGVEVYVREAPAEREPVDGVLGHRYLPLRSRAGKIRDVPAGGDVEGRKKRKRGVSSGPCRSHGPGPAKAPAPPPSPEPTRPAWTGMGLRAASSCAAAAALAAAAGAEQRPRPRLCPPPLALLLLLLLSLGLLHAGDCQQPAQCRIQKCTTDFVSLTSHLNSAIDGFDSEFCKALRAYAGCTQRTSKACRGNLVYHSAVLGISDLMSQRNCSKDGPTSSTNPEVTHDPCNYHSHAGAREHRGGDQNPPNYLFCGLFGDPHLRTFKDHFQTCKVEGAWPLIDNNYLSVQVTNVPVVPGSSATATDKASVLFSSFQ
ncbi:hypothetical protein EI555_015770 [Monodon monoceros]|uniref:Uncharacterized protein n=1 Tax=Monodon monoceros TaxID=40151 RepID=A0A4U1FJV3_MONMO|nr:hypothetical protein EI555_015770 [Monodon monoceros]